MGPLAANMDASTGCERKANRHDAEAQALIDGSQSHFIKPLSLGSWGR